MTITTKITATGPDSCCPDDPDAVDAVVYFDGEYAGEITLTIDHTGELTTWGGRDHWASSDLLERIPEGDDGCLDWQVVDAIVSAVRAAVK